MKKCNYCKSEIDDGAKVCPVCKRTQIKANGCLIALLVVLIWFFLVVIIAVSVDSGSESTNNNENIENVQLEQQIGLRITDAYITEDFIGQNQIHLSVKNDSEYTIDALDFKVESYNNYNEKLSNWGIDSFTKEDCSIVPNGTWSSGDTAWTLPFVNTATTFKVALTRYHIKETDETVNISSNNRVWIEVKK